MLNEHHQTATCVDPAAPLVLGALARLTKKARLLILGNPVANRRQPVRVAEEMALIDILSRGRLECGFVRGVPYEVLPANSNPVRMNERQWEAIDLIVKAWTQPRRAVQPRGPLLPPPQRQHLAAALSAAASADLDQHHDAERRAARRRARLRAGDLPHRLRPDARDLQLLPQGLARGRPRRATCRSTGSPMRAMVYVGQSESEAHAGADKLLWYMRANKVPFHYCNPPGYVPAAAQVQIMRGAALDQHAALKDKMVVEKAVEAGIMFAGTPDQVFGQIKRHYEHVGGYGHLLIMGQAGFLEHDETVAGIRTFAREVYPRLKEAFPDTRVSGLEPMAVAG